MLNNVFNVSIVLINTSRDRKLSDYKDVANKNVVKNPSPTLKSGKDKRTKTQPKKKSTRGVLARQHCTMQHIY